MGDGLNFEALRLEHLDGGKIRDKIEEHLLTVARAVADEDTCGKGAVSVKLKLERKGDAILVLTEIEGKVPKPQTRATTAYFQDGQLVHQRATQLNLNQMRDEMAARGKSGN